MKSNPILEEVWRIKEELAREAGYDMHTFCQQLREWARTHPHDGPVVRNADELRRLAAAQERQPADATAPALNEQPPKYGRD